MTKDDIIKLAREAGWSGLYTTYNAPTGKADWKMVNESLIVPVTMEQIERFAALVAAAERERIIAKNVPEIEKINTHIKALEEALLAERARGTT